MVLRRWAITKLVRPCIRRSSDFLDARLGAGVDAAGGFIQDQDRRVGQDGAGDGQQLALALAEVAGALGEHGLVALGQLADEVIGVGHLGGAGCTSSSRGIQPPVADVLHHRVGEQEGILQHQPQLAAQVVFLDVADIDAVDA